MSNQRVMLVTGASKGIGLEIVLEALDEGYTVVGTSRNAEKLKKIVTSVRPSLVDKFIGVSMNFNETDIQMIVAQVIERLGRLDVLVNNAGYGILGALEEFSISEVRENFDVNVFGVLSMMQAVLPHMRQQKSGHIINLASISGTVSGPSQAIYSASKAAVIMMSEALAEEIAPFNIQVTAICPGGVRTDFLDSLSMRRPEKHIVDYEVVTHTMESLKRLNHNQSGNPKLVAKAILAVATMDNPPKRLYLNSGAVAALQHKLNEIASEASTYLNLSLSTDGKM